MRTPIVLRDLGLDEVGVRTDVGGPCVCRDHDNGVDTTVIKLPMTLYCFTRFTDVLRFFINRKRRFIGAPLQRCTGSVMSVESTAVVLRCTFFFLSVSKNWTLRIIFFVYRFLIEKREPHARQCINNKRLCSMEKSDIIAWPDKYFIKTVVTLLLWYFVERCLPVYLWHFVVAT